MRILTGRLAVSASVVLLVVGARGVNAQVLTPPEFVAHFQNTTVLGVGWTPRVPVTALGFSAVFTTPDFLGGAGVYADLAWTTGSPAGTLRFRPNITPADAISPAYNDQHFDDDTQWFNVNVAFVYVLEPQLAMYGGVGYADKKQYRMYYDDQRQVIEDGFYWVLDPEASGARVNVLGGFLIRMTRAFVFQAGGNVQPPAATVGLVLTLPR